MTAQVTNRPATPGPADDRLARVSGLVRVEGAAERRGRERLGDGPAVADDADHRLARRVGFDGDRDGAGPRQELTHAGPDAASFAAIATRPAAPRAAIG